MACRSITCVLEFMSVHLSLTHRLCTPCTLLTRNSLRHLGCASIAAPLCCSPWPTSTSLCAALAPGSTWCWAAPRTSSRPWHSAGTPLWSHTRETRSLCIGKEKTALQPRCKHVACGCLCTCRTHCTTLSATGMHLTASQPRSTSQVRLRLSCMLTRNLTTVYAAFVRLYRDVGTPREPMPPPAHIRGGVDVSEAYAVPSLSSLGYKDMSTTSFVGGETDGLRRVALIVVCVHGMPCE